MTFLYPQTDADFPQTRRRIDSFFYKVNEKTQYDKAKETGEILYKKRSHGEKVTFDKKIGMVENGGN